VLLQTLRTGDFDELAGAFPGWDLRFRQLGRGPFRGRLQFLQREGTLLANSRWRSAGRSLVKMVTLGGDKPRLRMSWMNWPAVSRLGENPLCLPISRPGPFSQPGPIPVFWRPGAGCGVGPEQRPEFLDRQEPPAAGLGALPPALRDTGNGDSRRLRESEGREGKWNLCRVRHKFHNAESRIMSHEP
jgi:hypothetical protein